MEIELSKFIEAIEKVLGAVFPTQREPLNRYAQAVNILAELESRGYEVIKRRT